MTTGQDTMDGAGTIRVEVAHARPERQEIIAIDVPAGTTLAAAIALSGIEQRFPGLDAATSDVGIFGSIVKDRDQPLREGDRVEIYRPLEIDPKAARANRARGRKTSPDSD